MFWHVIQIALSYSTAGPCIFIFKSHRDCNSNDPNNNNTSLGGKGMSVPERTGGVSHGIWRGPDVNSHLS